MAGQAALPIWTALAAPRALEKWGITNEDVCIARNQYGKPCLVHQPEIHYNVSHSGEWVVCVVHSSPVGIDVQELKECSWGIVEQFFHPRERAYLSSLEKGQLPQAFCDVWSMKEAYIKAIGKGLHQPLQDFAVVTEPWGTGLPPDFTAVTWQWGTRWLSVP